MIHAHIAGIVTHDPQRRVSDDGVQFLRLRCDCRSVSQGRERHFKVIAELVGADMNRPIKPGDGIEVEGSATTHIVSESGRPPFPVLAIRARRVRIAPAVEA
jgi:hypothetical protein